MSRKPTQKPAESFDQYKLYPAEIKGTPYRKYLEEKEKHLLDQFFKRGRPLSYIANQFGKYGNRSEIERFMVRYDLFRKILDQPGVIVECGVHGGGSLMSWAVMSAILEPDNVFRQVIGFDTFQGFPRVHKKDKPHGSKRKRGDLKDESFEDLKKCIELFDLVRPTPHNQPNFEKVKLVKGDFLKAGPRFLKDNKHLLISLLYLDFDLYEPTKCALDLFLPRMASGSILCFDQINNPVWPGETQALLERLKLRKTALKKMPYEAQISYVVL